MKSYKRGKNRAELTAGNITWWLWWRQWRALSVCFLGLTAPTVSPLLPPPPNRWPRHRRVNTWQKIDGASLGIQTIGMGLVVWDCSSPVLFLFLSDLLLWISACLAVSTDVWSKHKCFPMEGSKQAYVTRHQYFKCFTVIECIVNFDLGKQL